MNVTKIYCDHCKKEIDPMTEYDDTTIEVGHLWLKADLCKYCLEKLFSIISDYCGKGGE